MCNNFGSEKTKIHRPIKANLKFNFMQMGPAKTPSFFLFSLQRCDSGGDDALCVNEISCILIHCQSFLAPEMCDIHQNNDRKRCMCTCVRVMRVMQCTKHVIISQTFWHILVPHIRSNRNQELRRF